MNNKVIYKTIYKKIKKFDKIVIARHVGPDPDALASQIALRDVILNTFPNKKVYAIGHPAPKFKYLGVLDKFDEALYEDALLITTDVPNKSRVDGADPTRFKDSIKIDHHPFVEEFCNFEWIDDTASSAAQMVVELIFNTRLKMTKEAAEKLYLGIVADTNRFLFDYTSPKTFYLVSNLIKKTNIDFTRLYEHLYLRPIKEVKFEGFITSNMTVTENGLGYIKLDENTLKEYDVDAATAGNMVNNFNFIEEVEAWVVFSYDAKVGNVRGSIRSRGPIINESAARFGGGGHVFASGVRLKDFDECDKLIADLDNVCKEYRKNNE